MSISPINQPADLDKSFNISPPTSSTSHRKRSTGLESSFGESFTEYLQSVDWSSGHEKQQQQQKK